MVGEMLTVLDLDHVYGLTFDHSPRREQRARIKSQPVLTKREVVRRRLIQYHGGIHVGRQLHLDKIHFKWPPLHRSFVVVRIGVSFVLVLVPCGAGTGSEVLLVVASPCRQTGVSGSWGGSSAAAIPPSSHCADHWVPTPSTAADCHSWARGVEKCHSRCLGVMLFRCSPSSSYFGRPPHT